jgi:hypothetical protein
MGTNPLKEDGLRGITGNPAILEKAIGASRACDKS